MRWLAGVPVLCLVALGAGGCLFSSAGGFASGRDESVCDSTVPVCGTAGGCVLDADHYLKGNFPGERRFIVRTHGEADINVTLYFEEARSPGADTNIYIYESGCVERFAYETAGRDIFNLAGPDMEFSWSARVYQEGDHLLEVNSDSLSGYLLKVDVTELTVAP